MAVTVTNFGTTASGEKVTCFSIENKNGMKVKVLDFGCTIQSIIVPDRSGNPTDVALGYDTIEGYEKGSCFYGMFVGRYANRIGKSEFQLDGKTFRLMPNEGENHLHGCYTEKIFRSEINGNAVIFRYTSPDGEEGYPGQVEVEVCYSVTDDNSLILEYRAWTDADTVINLTNHTYFNLNGHNSGTALDHSLWIAADTITEVDSESIPTGKILNVSGTPFDFRKAKLIGRDLDLTEEQLSLTNGYDHNFILNTESAEEAYAKAVGEQTGICMTCYTTQPAVQFYNANFIQNDSASGMGKGGAIYEQRGAFCLETQHYPDSPNHPEFPSTVLRPGEEYHHVSKYTFSVEE